MIKILRLYLNKIDNLIKLALVFLIRTKINCYDGLARIKGKFDLVLYLETVYKNLNLEKLN